MCGERGGEGLEECWPHVPDAVRAYLFLGLEVYEWVGDLSSVECVCPFRFGRIQLCES